MPRSLGALLALLFVFATSVAAQAPRVTSSGDPTIRPDSIYRLAVDPSAYPDEDYIFLLDDGIIRVEADGRTTTTYRQIVQLLNDKAVENFSERRYGWSPEREKFRLNWIRVVRPDGTVISDGPAQKQESDVPVAMGNPVYSSRKQLRVTMSGLAAGTILDYSFTTEETKNSIAGDFSTSWGITTGVPTLRSRYILDTPAEMRVNLREWNLDFPVREDRPRGRLVRTWATSQIPVVKPQRFATDTGPKYMHLAVSGPVTWEAIGAWYGGLAKDRYAVPAAVAAAADKQVASAATLMDSVRAIHRWVAQDIRYVSISLGLGGYQPRTPEEVARTGFGDCKDKATLFVAVLRRWGIPASTVLLSSYGSVDSSMPSLNAFDHAIARIDLPGGVVYTDLTADVVPFGELPMTYEGSMGLVVEPAGKVERIHFPYSVADSNLAYTKYVGTIDTLGRISGSMLVRNSGVKAFRLRGNYYSPMDPTAKSDLLRRIAQQLFEGARGDSLWTFEGKDLNAVPRIQVWYSNGKAMRRSGTSWILPNPLGSMADNEDIAGEVEHEMERDGGRWEAIDIAAVNDPTAVEIEVEFHLPAGWKAQLPPDVSVQGAFGTYEAHYTQSGDAFRATRRMVGTRGAIAPSRVNELLAFLRGTAADNTPYITVQPAGR